MIGSDGEAAPRGGAHPLVGLGRALAGALIFALPMLMTMEMWFLGFYIDRLRLLLLIAATLPLLVALAHFVGFEETFGWREDVRDALVALAVGAVTSGLVLWLLGVITRDAPLDDIVGKVALQTVPASIGALLASSQLGGEGQGEGEDEPHQPSSYLGELFFMMVGALFLSLNVAPTEEIVLIAYRIAPGQELLLALLSLLIMHVFVYAVNFHGAEPRPEDAGFWGLFLYFTVVGYAIVLLTSCYVLWTFGRLEDVAFMEQLSATIVLAFPGAVGAAGARLLL
jgi:putative integral membrane protein (TIGR02587 family)